MEIIDTVPKSQGFAMSEIFAIENDARIVRGSVKCVVEDDVLGTFVAHEKHNLIVQGARKALARLSARAVADYAIATFKLGTGGHVSGDILIPVSPSITDTDLEASTFSKVIDHDLDTYNPPPPNETSVTFQVVLEKLEGNGSGIVAYTEAGLVCANGILFARETFPAVIKNSGRKVTFYWSLLY